MAATPFDVAASRAVLVAAGRVRLPRRPRRLAGARRGRRRDRARAAGGEREPGRALRDQPAGRAILEEAERNAARFLGCRPDEVIFGANMTSLDFTLSRTAAATPARRRDPGLRLDHDGGVAPWLELAATRASWSGDRAQRRHRSTSRIWSASSGRARVVAFAWASNAVGTVVDARRVSELAHDAGALAWVDAVHYAAHEPIDVARSAPTC